MPITIDGTGTISGVSATGITTAQTVSATNITTGTLPFAQLPTGSVLQVVMATHSTEVTNNTDTYADTGLTATITPKYSTSKVLVLANNMFSKFTNINAGGVANIVRNSTQIIEYAKLIGYTGTTSTGSAAASVSYLDSPATTSATTYKTQQARSSGAGNVQTQSNEALSTITLMEIAA